MTRGDVGRPSTRDGEVSGPWLLDGVRCWSTCDGDVPGPPTRGVRRAPSCDGEVTEPSTCVGARRFSTCDGEVTGPRSGPICDGVVVGAPTGAGARMASVACGAGLSARVAGCVGSTCGSELAPPTRTGGCAATTCDGVASTGGGTRRLSACDGDVIGPPLPPLPGVDGVGADCVGGGVVRTSGAVNFVGGELGRVGSDDGGDGGGVAVAGIGGELKRVGGAGASDGALACAPLPSSHGATTQRAAA